MTSEDSQTVENEALLKKAGAMEQEVAALKAAIRCASVTRLVLFLVALALIVGAVCSFYGLAKKLTSKENLTALANAAKELLDDNPQYVEQVKAVIEESTPKLQEAFLNQVKEDMPKYSALVVEERERLMETFPDRVRERITERYEEVGGEYQDILREEFPEVDDDETYDKMKNEVYKIVDQLVEKYYAEQVREEILRTYDGWDHFAMVDPIREGDISLEKQLMATLLELVKLRLEDTTVPTTP